MLLLRSFRRKEQKARKPCVHQQQQPSLEYETKPATTDALFDRQPTTPAAEADEKGIIAPALPAAHTSPTTAQQQGPPNNSTDQKPCPECKRTKHNERIYRWKLVAGLVIPYTLASLDLTIVATATPYIASHFGKLNQLSWIATAFTLTSTAFIPTFGQLADILGRHAVLQTTMVLMIIGSVLCAAAQAWGMLLLGRALQGTSAAGIMNLIKIILSDKVSLEQNSKNTTIFVLVGGIGYSIGPIIGGYLTNASWRYCFVLPIPLSVLASLLAYFVLRKELVRGTHQDRLSWKKPSSFASIFTTLDVGGTFLFIFGVGLMIIAVSWGGSTFAWSSPAVLVPIVLGPILFFGFFLYEYLLEPGRLVNRLFPKQIGMIPWSLFKRQDTLLLAVINFATGAALYSIFYFMGIYYIVAQGFAAGNAGVNLLFYLPGIAVGVYACMFMCNVWPGQTWWPLFIGCVVEAAGFGLIAWAVTTSKIGLVRGMTAVAGAGTGLRFMPCTLHGVGIWPNKIASVLSVMDFALPFGGTLGLAIMGSVFNNKIAESAASLGGSGSTIGHQELSKIRHLPSLIKHMVRQAAGKAVMWSFISILPVMACSILAALFLGNVWVKGRKKDGTAEVIYSPYLFAVVTGTLNAKKTSNRASELEGEEANVDS